MINTFRGFTITLEDGDGTELYDFEYAFRGQDLKVGTIDANALEKFDSATEFLRRGDNIVTPEVLTISGYVTKSTLPLLRTEINNIKTALETVYKVIATSYATTRPYKFTVTPVVNVEHHIMTVEEVRHSRLSAKINIQFNTASVIVQDDLITYPPEIFELVGDDLEDVDGYSEGDTLVGWTGRVNSIDGTNTGGGTTNVALDRSSINDHDMVRLLSSSSIVQVGSTGVNSELITDEVSFALVVRPSYALVLNVNTISKGSPVSSNCYRLQQTSATIGNREFRLISDWTSGVSNLGPSAWSDLTNYVVIGVLANGRQELYVNDGVTAVATSSETGVLQNQSQQLLLNGSNVRVPYFKAWNAALSTDSVAAFTVVFGSLDCTKVTKSFTLSTVRSVTMSSLTLTGSCISILSFIIPPMVYIQSLRHSFYQLQRQYLKRHSKL